MDSGAPSAKKLKLRVKLKLSLEMELVFSEGLSDDEEPTASQMGVPDAALVERILGNFDVWERIFAFMGLRERIQAEMVNKRLRSVMFALWARETSFDTASVIKELIGDPEKKKRADGVLAICGRIGNGLRSLELTDELTLDWSKDLSSISNACPNIESIHFRVDARDVDDCFSVPPNLRFDMFINLNDLFFSSPSASVDGELDWVCAPACVFLSIPSSIERIVRLEGLWSNASAQFETGQQLEQFFADRPSLRSIRLASLRTLDDSKADIFRVIAQQCPLLKQLCVLDSNAIDIHGLVSLKSMEEMFFRSDEDLLSDAEMIEICERNPLVEDLKLNGFPFDALGVSALGAVAALTNLRDLFLTFRHDMPEAQVTKCVRQLARNSGASLRCLDLWCPLSTAAIEALAARCTKLRRLKFSVSVGDATPESIRHLIDCIVADPTWNPNDHNLCIRVRVFAHAATFAPFEALNGAAANLPAGVNLSIIPC